VDRFRGARHFLTTKVYQDDVYVMLGGMVLARGTVKIAISFSAGIRAVRVKDFQLIFTLLGATISQKSTLPQTTSFAPRAPTADTVLLQTLPKRCAQAIHHHDTGEDRDKNRSHLIVGDKAQGSNQFKANAASANNAKDG